MNVPTTIVEKYQLRKRRRSQMWMPRAPVKRTTPSTPSASDGVYLVDPVNAAQLSLVKGAMPIYDDLGIIWPLRIWKVGVDISIWRRGRRHRFSFVGTELESWVTLISEICVLRMMLFNLK